MNPEDNPYAPGAGTRPPALVGRNSVLADAKVALARIRKGASHKSALLVGLRGVGKTVLLVTINDIAVKMGYQVVRIEAPENIGLPQLLAPPLRDIILRLDRMAGVSEAVKRGIRVLKSFSLKIENDGALNFGLGVEPEFGVADSGDLQTDLTALFLALGEAAAARNTSVAIIIDEMQYIDEKELGALISALHVVGQHGFPLILIGAGLPQLVALVGEAKSYAERLFTFPKIDALNEKDATEALTEPAEKLNVSFDLEAVQEILRLTHGYPYFIQEWGYEAWNFADSSPITLEHIKQVTEQVISKLDSDFFRVRFDRLTPAERIYLRAMAQLGPGPHRSGDITDVLGVGVKTKAPVRSALIKKGMIFSPAHGDTAFTVPLFDEFMLRTLPRWEPNLIGPKVKSFSFSGDQPPLKRLE